MGGGGDSDAPATSRAHRYTVRFTFCQSMCGSAYAASYPKDFGQVTTTFTVTE